MAFRSTVWMFRTVLTLRPPPGAGLAAGRQKICVEGVKVLGREALQRHCANPGYDVVDDVAAVGLEGAGAELGLLGRQPSLQEVLAERDPVGSRGSRRRGSS